VAALVRPQWAHCAKPALPGPDGTPLVLMVATPDSTVRDEARVLVRAALRSFLAPLLGCTPAAVPLHLEPGKAPRLDTGSRPVPLSISHEAGLSLAALRTGGGIGVDLMRGADAGLPDWQTIAHDYLGPDALAMLLGLGLRDRQPAFARAWTRHEASLKCLGLQLQEWSPDLARELGRCGVSELLLPSPYIGALALLD
jgi:4'-phosphopantetheinyl transferase